MNLRSWRSRPRAIFALAVYALATVALPILHRRHHRLDHVHLADGSIRHLDRDADAGEFLVADAGEGPDRLEHHHVAFDSDLVALELAEAAHFGIAEVDCELAAYTLAQCDAPADAPAGAAPPHSFGDELLARLADPHHAHSDGEGQPFDPAHGLGSLEHGRSVVLSAPYFFLPPPALAVSRATPLPVDTHPGYALLAPPAARGPPAPLSRSFIVS